MLYCDPRFGGSRKSMEICSCFEVIIHKMGVETSFSHTSFPCSFLTLVSLCCIQGSGAHRVAFRDDLWLWDFHPRNGILCQVFGILPFSMRKKHINKCHHSDVWCSWTNFFQRGGSIWPAWAEESSSIPKAFSTNWGQALMLTISLELNKHLVSMFFLKHNSPN